MERQIDIGEAENHLGDLIRDVAAGESVTVTEDGRPVARLVPVEEADRADDPQPRQSFEEFAAFLRSQPFRVIGPWTREDLYD